MILYPPKVNLNLFASDTPLAKYGLPSKVKYCKRCVISNQRPNSAVEYNHTAQSIKYAINFDEDGVCDACRYADMKKTSIDWDQREKELEELCNRHRRNDGRYDCIIPGSGGKDSFYAAHQLKYRFGMHPLTVTWAPHLYTDWGRRNHQRWIDAGFDNYLVTPNPLVHRLLTRLAVDNLFHPFQPFMIGQKSLAPKIALLHDVKLVVYGENEAEYGNPVADSTKSQRDKSYFSGNAEFLGGQSVMSLKEDFGLTDIDLEPYMPARDIKDTEVHYLGYYLKWHPQTCYYYAIEFGGFECSPERTPGTYSKYNSIDDKIDDFHYFTTGIKFGIGRATYDAAQEIRSGDITRDEGVALVRKFDHEWPSRFAGEIFKYLSIGEQYPIASKMFEQPQMDIGYFHALTNNFRSPHIWKWDNDNWKLRTEIEDMNHNQEWIESGKSFEKCLTVVTQRIQQYMNDKSVKPVRLVKWNEFPDMFHTEIEFSPGSPGLLNDWLMTQNVNV